MKKIVAILSMVLVVCLTLCLTACGGDAECEHTYEDWFVLEEPTCTESGIQGRTCTKCGAVETETLAALSHDPVLDEAVEPTCEETGKTQGAHCKRCGMLFVLQEEVPALGHELVFVDAVDPTCLSDGNNEHYHCTTCGKNFAPDKQDQVFTENDILRPALGHFYGDWSVVREATCTEEGLREQRCTRCDELLDSESIPPRGHSLTHTPSVAASCTQDGKDEYWYCSNCDTYFADAQAQTAFYDIDSYGNHSAYGHHLTFVAEQAATCTQAGNWEYYHCENCGKCYKDNAAQEEFDPAIAPLGHHMEEQTVHPTCTTDGYYTAACDRCDYYIYEVIPATEHDYVLIREIAPTCTVDGYRLYACTHCQDKKTVVDYASGHIFGYDNVCDICGYTYPIHEHHLEATVVDPTCTTMGYTVWTCDCGYSYRTDFIEPFGHRMDEGVVTEEPDCEHTGIRTYTCTLCGETYDEVISVQHDWVVHETPATCEQDGAIERTCLNCDAQEIEVIPAHHIWAEAEILEPGDCEHGATIRRTCTVCGFSETVQDDPEGHQFENGVCVKCGKRFPEIVTPDPDHPEYGLYFLVDEIRSAYGDKLVNEYGVLLYVNEDAELDRVAIYLTQDGTMWRRCIAFTGSNVEFAYFVPYLSHDNDIYYTGMNHPWINTFRLQEGADGIWRYSEYATIGANLEDYQGNLLLSLYDIGQAGSKTRVFDDLTEMKIWLGGGDPDVPHEHTAVIDEEIPATCTENGLTAGSHCAVCGEVLEGRTIIPAHGHHFEGEWVTIEPTCTQEGRRERYCSYDSSHKQIELIPALQHDYVLIDSAPAGCGTPGYIEYRCERCQDVYRIVIAAGNHNYVLIEEECVEATCTEPGLIVYRCSYCGDNVTQEVISAHDYQAEVVEAPTTESTGLRRYTCSKCGDYYDEIIPMLREGNRRILVVQNSHAWGSNANAEMMDLITDADYITDWTITTVSGLASIDLYEYDVIFVAFDDQSTSTYDAFSAYTGAIASFAEDGGVVVYALCDHGHAGGSISFSLPSGVTKGNSYSPHNYIRDNTHPIVTGEYTDSVVLTDALLYGSYCSHTYFTNLPADATVILVDGNGNPTLAEYSYGTGHIILSGLTWEYYWVRSSEGAQATSYAKVAYDDLLVYATEIRDPITHTYEFDHLVEPTCEEGGYSVFICKDCGKERHMFHTPTLGHELGEWELVYEALCTEDGLRVRRCLHCGEIADTQILPALDHDLISEEILAPTVDTPGLRRYTCARCQYSFEVEIPRLTNRGGKVLLVQERNPWSFDSNIVLLNRLVENGYIDSWTKTTVSGLDSRDLDEYAVIMIANSQDADTENALASRNSMLESYVERGGVLLYGACENYGTITLPFNIGEIHYGDYYNYIRDNDHPIVTAELTDGNALNDSDLYGDSCSHDYFTNLPADANVILVNSQGDPTLVEFAYGGGYCILSALTWECFYEHNDYNSKRFAVKAYDDLVVYAASLGGGAASHNYRLVRVVQPTCTEQGYSVYICDDCGRQHLADYTEMIPHNYEWSVALEPTCTTPGERTYACTVCGYVSSRETIPALGHTLPEDWTVTLEPTCTTPGERVKVCSVCENVVESETISALGHDYEDNVCTRCGERRQSTITWMDVTGSSDHISVTLQGTTIFYYPFTPTYSGTVTLYSSGGVDTYGYLYNAARSQLSSDDDSNGNYNFLINYSVTAGTLYYAGIRAYGSGTTGNTTLWISGCGAAFESENVIATETVSIGSEVRFREAEREGYHLLGWSMDGELLPGESFVVEEETVTLTAVWEAHTEGEWTVTLEPSCTTEGERVKLCTVCEQVIRRETISVLDHTLPEDWTVTVEPTCTTTGERVKVCSECEQVILRETISVLDHTLPEEWTVTVEPTCTTTGERVKLCTVCENEVLRESIPALGHEYEDYVCVRCGDALQSTITWIRLRETSSNVSVRLQNQTVFYYPFTPTSSGTVTLYSTGSADTYGFLYNSARSQLSSNDDSGENNNFRITYSVTAGTLYYAGIRAYSNSTSTVTLWVSGCGAVFELANDSRSETVQRGSEVPFPAEVREGYHLLGWRKDGDILPGESFVVEEETVTLTAVWEAHSEGAWTVTQEPTCYAAGAREKRCTLCGDVLQTEVLAALTHDMTHVDRVEPTCVSLGKAEYWYCENCHGYFEDASGTVAIEDIDSYGILAMAHLPGDWVITFEPTCVSSGEREQRCAACDSLLRRETIPALGHDYVLTDEQAATCTEDGYRTYVCSRCDDTKTIIDLAHGHVFGYDNVCDICGYTYEIHEHDFEETVVPPTCTMMGYTLYTCECGLSYRADFIEAPGHYMDEGVVTREATCTEPGVITYTCLNCDYSYTVEIPAAHQWTVIGGTPATCLSDGLIRKVCDICGLEEGEIIPASHTWGEEEILEEGDCEHGATIRRTCTVCGFTETFVGEPEGHHFVNGVCTKCGKRIPEVVTPDPDHPEYGMYFLIDDIRSAYGDKLVNEYGVLLYVNEGAILNRVAIYLTQDNTMWRRCIAFTGSNIEFAYYVPYLSYGEDIYYTGLNHASINTFRLQQGADGIWRYSEYATIGVNLADYQGHLLLSLYDIGQAGDKTRIFDDLSEMKIWLAGGDPAAHQHTVVIDEEIPATCTANGLSAGSHCSVCGEVLTARTILPALGHSFTNRWIVIDEPTCTETGEQKLCCDRCDEISEYAEIPALGHLESDWIIVTDPTCTEAGLKEKRCVRCEAQLTTESISALGHILSEEWETLSEATCTEEGVEVRRCARCGEIGDSRALSASGHEHVDDVCIHCGHVERHLYFGSYPQSAVTDQSLVSTLTSKAGTLPTAANSRKWTSYDYYAENSNATDYMWYIDVEQGGEKYRGVYFTSYRPSKTTDSGTANKSRQDDNGYTTSNVYWFKYEPLKWRYLAEGDGEALLICDVIIDSQEYYYTTTPRTLEGDTVYGNNYAESHIRAWLNATFYETAFSAAEKELILLTNVENGARSTNPNNNATAFNEGNNLYACEDTEDYIFLLGEQEATTGAYGFNSSYGVGDEVRRKQNTDYAKSQGVWTSRSGSYAGNGCWWLRTPYYGYNYGVLAVNEYGSTDLLATVTEAYNGVVPALRIRVVTTPVEEEIAQKGYARVDEEGSLSEEGGYLLFGSYPQSEVTDATVVRVLNAAAGALPTAENSGRWTSYEYYIEGSNATDFMWYIDLEYAGDTYRGVYFISYRPYYTISSSSTGNSYQDDNGYETGAVYWFKYEPIKWRILSEEDGEALILCEMLIDSQEYYNSTNTRTIDGNSVYANNYAYSNIRAWLNSVFYETAFSDLQRELILLTTVDNSARSTNPNGNATLWDSGNNSYACMDTEDYLFLLSVQETSTASYDFNGTYSATDPARQKEYTDYAKSQGVYTKTLANSDGYWWLRSPYNSYSHLARIVYADGMIDGGNVYDTDVGVAPALRIRLGGAETPTDPGEETPVELLEGYLRVNAEGVEDEGGDYLLFGNYPQSEVTDEALTAALTAAAGTLPTAENSGRWTSYEYYIEGSNDTDFMWYIDLPYEGNLYRGVYFTSYRPYWMGNSGSADYSNQDDNGYGTSTVYWFKYEPIKWRILSEANGEALILCEMIIDSQEYYIGADSFTINGQTFYANNYAESNIRKWLNDTFYHAAFSDLQKQLIVLTTVDNSARSTNPNNNATAFNGGTNTYACANTEDYIFLLSEQEVTNSACGFDSSYSNDDTARRKQNTDYAKAQGVWTSAYSGYEGNGYWWLRSPDSSNCYYARNVYSDGIISNTNVDDDGRGVVPALRIRLSAAETPTDPGEETPVELLEGYLRVDADGVEDEAGDYLLFGNYPQSEVTDEELTAALTAAAGTLPTAADSGRWTSYEYYISGSNATDFMWYIDIEYAGDTYRGVYFTSYRPKSTTSSSSTSYSYQDDNGYETGIVYWFRYEPIKWRILSEEGGEALILCEMLIDSREFDYDGSDGSYYNNYKESTIRSWLNSVFYETAFSDLQKELILLTTVDNSARSTNPNDNATQWNSGNNYYACEDTEDYLFLLSMQDATNRTYGFNSDPFTYDIAREKKTTDYAQAQGAYTVSGGDYDGNGRWWLRSPYYDGGRSAWCVSGSGDGNISYSSVNGTHSGVLPALRIRLGGAETPTDPGEETPVALLEGYLRVDAEGVEDEAGDYLLFGNYPQSEVTDEELTAALTAAAGTLPTAEDSGRWTSYEYYIEGSNDTDFMWYIDIPYEGNLYRGVYFTSYRPYGTTDSSSVDHSYQDENGYTTGTVYWFKYEPIKWRILSEEDGEALILCESILDSREFDYDGSNRSYYNNYKESTIRAWLNSVFYETAFSDLQRELILLTIVDNSARSANPNGNATYWNGGANQYVCEDTEDYVFLLSMKEATNTVYEFSSNYGTSITREKKTTDFAQAQGAYTYSGGSNDGNGAWWLRSPDYDGDNFAWCVNTVGYISSGYVYRMSNGVVPALRIRLSAAVSIADLANVYGRSGCNSTITVTQGNLSETVKSAGDFAEETVDADGTIYHNLRVYAEGGAYQSTEEAGEWSQWSFIPDEYVNHDVIQGLFTPDNYEAEGDHYRYVGPEVNGTGDISLAIVGNSIVITCRVDGEENTIWTITDIGSTEIDIPASLPALPNA